MSFFHIASSNVLESQCGSASGNIELLRKQNSLFPSRPVSKCYTRESGELQAYESLQYAYKYFYR